MKKYLLYLSLTLFSCAAQSQMQDLTYPFDEKTIYWPTEKGFSIQKVSYGMTDKGYFYSAFKFCMPEHGGTHIDAPRHFSKTGYTVDEIPLLQLKGAAVVIDVHAAVKKNRDYAIKVDDIRQFEQTHRALSNQDIVIFYTGWGRYWGDKRAYLGSDKAGDVTHLHFPGLSKKAAEYLVWRHVKGVGLDTPSLDVGVSQSFWAHRVLLGANIYGLENIANVEKLPALGSTLIVSPLKIKGGSGGPTRIYAQ
jgi:kynurenine formamidase